MLIPTTESKLLAKWNGPYDIVEQVGNVNYLPNGEEKTPPALPCEFAEKMARTRGTVLNVDPATAEPALC